MRLNFFRPPQVKKDSSTRTTIDLEDLHQKILFRNLVSFLIATLGLFIISLPGWIEQNLWGLILVFMIAVFWLVADVFVANLTFTFKAVSFLSMGIVLGLACLVTDGLFGSGIIFLLATSLIAGLLFRAQRSFLVLLVAAIPFVITAFMIKSNYQHPSLLVSLYEPLLFTWLISGFCFVIVGSGLIFSILPIRRGLEKSIMNEKRLVESIDLDHAKLEHRLLQSTQDYERRLGQIRSALDISYAMRSDIKLDQLLQNIVNLFRERFNYYYVGVYLLDDQKEYAVLKAGTGEAGAAMLESGHRVAVNDTSVVGWSIQHQQAKVAVDVGFDAVHFNNPLLSLTRSELILPLILPKDDSFYSNDENLLVDTRRNRVLGAMTIQSSDAKAFNQEDILNLQELANALAIAIGNTIFIRQLEKNNEESQKLYRQYLQEAWKEVAQLADNKEFSYRTSLDFQIESSQDTARSEYSFPVKLRDQEIGQLILELDNPELKEEERIFIEAVTSQAAVALENVRLIERNQRQAGYERLLSDISRKVSVSTNLDTILQVTLREVAQVMKASGGMIQLEIPTGEGEEQG